MFDHEVSEKSEDNAFDNLTKAITGVSMAVTHGNIKMLCGIASWYALSVGGDNQWSHSINQQHSST